MARRWVVLSAARSGPTIAVNTIIEYTEWAGRSAESDEVIYTDPVDASDDPVDGNWKVGGTVTLSGTTYTYTDPSGETVADDITAAAGQKRAALRSANDQLDRWGDSLNRQGKGQSSAIRNLGHDLILGQRKALYLRGANSALSVAAIQSYAGQISQGASDVTNVRIFYRLAAGLRKGSWTDGDPVEWATLTNNVATRRGLQAAITAAPTDFVAGVRDFTNVDLGTDDWIETAVSL